MLPEQQDRQRLYPQAIRDIAAKLRGDDNLTVRVGMDTNLCNNRHDFYVNYIFHNVVTAIILTNMDNLMDYIFVL